MAQRSAKRRKVAHQASDINDDEASSASFGSSENHKSGEHGHFGEDSLSEESEQDEDGKDHAAGGEAHVGAVQRRLSLDAQWNDRGKTGPRTKSSALDAHFSAGTFKSNVFKLQVDDLLEQIRPKHGKREIAAEQALHQLKQGIESAPDRPPRSIEDAERQLHADEIVIPFPSPRPPKGAKYKLEYRTPAHINVVGSYATKTTSRKSMTEIDMMVAMPPSLFQEKDYINHRYFYKRAYYLACVASALRSAHLQGFRFRFQNWRGDPLKPILVVTPEKVADEHADKPHPKWQINVIPSIPADVFAVDKLLPHKNSVRSSGPPVERSSRSGDDQDSTSFYNSSLRADTLMASYLKLLHNTRKRCTAFQDACLLGGTWLRQRGFQSEIHAGGFGNFEWSVLVALLLAGGGSGGRPLLSERYSSYQLLKAVMQMLAVKDFAKQPLSIGSDQCNFEYVQDGSPVVWDGERSHNILYKMSPWSFRSIRQEAKTTLSMLNDQAFDAFEATFILRADGALYRFDYVMTLDSPPLDSTASKCGHDPLRTSRKLHSTLVQGLGDRVEQVNVKMETKDTWDVGSASASNLTHYKIIVGFIVNADTANRTVDHGPSTENKAEAVAFRKFWGEKAELRRFKDGSILESLVWSANTREPCVLEQIVKYLLGTHFGERAKQSATITGDACKKILSEGSETSDFQTLTEAYRQLEIDIRGLDGLPLSIRQIMPAGARLRNATIRPPTKRHKPVPSDVVLQFEASGRWPDDLVAIQRTKIAFLLKLSELLQASIDSVTARVGLENEATDVLNQAFLDVIYDSGPAFRIRIYHDREQTLLERQLKDKTLGPKVKEAAALALGKHKRDYIKAPLHTQAMARLCSRHPAMSGTIRLMKKWFASHLLSNHVAEEVIELLVARTFIQPWPWQPPSTLQTGFYRTIHWLSRWDWRAEPLIVDTSGSGDLKEAGLRAITTNFEAWRKLDPALNRIVLFAASTVDSDGTTWSDGRPAKVVAGRMTALAKAACAEIDERQLDLEPTTLFSSPLTDFDFTLHLNAKLSGHKAGKRHTSNGGTTFKNIDIGLAGDQSASGYDLVYLFVDELEQLFGSAVLLLSAGHERPVIAGLWNPQTSPRPWKLNLPYSTVPQQSSNDGDVLAHVNKDAILAEMARLGGDMIERIEVHR